MSYVHTALIASLQVELKGLKERVEVLESGVKPQPKVGKAATAEAKDGFQEHLMGVAKGVHQSELKAPPDGTKGV